MAFLNTKAKKMAWFIKEVIAENFGNVLKIETKPLRHCTTD